MNVNGSKSAAERLTLLPVREQRGSRARCLLLTDGPSESVADRLTSIIAPHGAIDPVRHHWMPRGLSNRREAKLGECLDFLSSEQRQALTSWWLVNRVGANTPNWDIASTADINGARGLVLVEAKAHTNEFKLDGKKLDGDSQNHAQIKAAVEEANLGLNLALPGWQLSCDYAYQLCNRFAWAWKIAKLGTPVILVYLGFLRAYEMRDQGEPFADEEAWSTYMTMHCRKVVPTNGWDMELLVDRVSLRALVRSEMVSLD